MEVWEGDKILVNVDGKQQAAVFLERTGFACLVRLEEGEELKLHTKFVRASDGTLPDYQRGERKEEPTAVATPPPVKKAKKVPAPKPEPVKKEEPPKAEEKPKEVKPEPAKKPEPAEKDPKPKAKKTRKAKGKKRAAKKAKAPKPKKAKRLKKASPKKAKPEPAEKPQEAAPKASKKKASKVTLKAKKASKAPKRAPAKKAKKAAKKKPTPKPDANGRLHPMDFIPTTSKKRTAPWTVDVWRRHYLQTAEKVKERGIQILYADDMLFDNGNLNLSTKGYLFTYHDWDHVGRGIIGSLLVRPHTWEELEEDAKRTAEEILKISWLPECKKHFHKVMVGMALDDPTYVPPGLGRLRVTEQGQFWLEPDPMELRLKEWERMKAPAEE